MQPSDGTDPEAFLPAQFSRINDISQLAEPRIEFLELERYVLRVAIGGDDAALILRREVNFKAKLLHPAEEDVMIPPVARPAAGNSTLRIELLQSLPECKQNVGGRSEPELPVLFESGPLRVQVEAQRSRLALRRLELDAARQGEPEARNPFDALVRRGDQKVDMG